MASQDHLVQQYFLISRCWHGRDPNESITCEEAIKALREIMDGCRSRHLYNAAEAMLNRIIYAPECKENFT